MSHQYLGLVLNDLRVFARTRSPIQSNACTLYSKEFQKEFIYDIYVETTINILVCVKKRTIVTGFVANQLFNEQVYSFM